MKYITKFVLVFLLLTLIVLVADRYFNATFGDANYWDYHGLFFLFFLATFPRLTLLFSSVVSGGILWWLAWLFVPRFLVAILATVSYWHQNPILVTLAWVIAISAESSEKYVVIKKVSPLRRRHVRPTFPEGEIIDIKPD